MKQAVRDFLGDGKPVLVAAAVAHEEGRRVLWQAQPSRRARWSFLIAAWIAAPGLAWSIHGQSGPIWMHLTFIVLLATVIPLLVVLDWHESEYVLTPSALLVKNGLFSPHVTEVAVEDIREAQLHVGLLQRLLGLASLRLTLDGGEVRLNGLRFEEAWRVREYIADTQALHTNASAHSSSFRKSARLRPL